MFVEGSSTKHIIIVHGNQTVKFFKCLKINSSEAIRGIKLKRCSIVHNTGLYKNIVLYCHCLSTLVAIATLNFHRFREKCKLAFIAISLQIFWQKFFFFRNVCWVVLYQTYTFCPNLSIWLVVMVTERLNLWKLFKSHLLRSCMGDKAETLPKMFIDLASTKMLFIIAVAYAAT